MEPTPISPGFGQPEFLLVILNLLLMKLGGQITFNCADIVQVSHDYAGTRFAFNDQRLEMTLTLHTRENPPDDFGERKMNYV